MIGDLQIQEQQPDVSVLIVNYNVKDYLLQCLRSVKASEGTASIEIIVVDNASSDNSISELRELFPDVVWVELPENIGFGRGNNVGLKHCKGKYVLFLNPDTLIAHNTVQTMVDYLEAHSDVGLAGCKVLNADGTFQLACRRGLPTPWASFCKLFGLQALFPNSPLFARYNLTYKSVDETYDVDALIGAFMMGRLEVVRSVNGFDPEFFMYGEDLDLCYRIQKRGLHVRYVHTTSIVHFKGESTRRSSIDEVQIFYNAMRIFARKHFGRSTLFLGLMAVGITVRSVVERTVKKKRDIILFLADLLSINISLMAATAVRFASPLGFPDYAYPTVFIVVTVVVALALFSLGEYVEYKPSIRRSVVGLLIAFFLLSSLTYFFKEYAFSRGVVLMTIGFSAALFSLIRGINAWFDATKGDASIRRIVIVGLTDSAKRIIGALQTAERRNAEIVGVVSVGSLHSDTFHGIRVLGTTEYLDKIARENEVHEVIVADPQIKKSQVMDLMSKCSDSKARFHIASEYDDIVIARVINEVSGIEPTVPMPPILRFRNRVLKRLIDVAATFCIMPFLAISLFLGKSKRKTDWQSWLSVLRGEKSLVGLYPDTRRRSFSKLGNTSLVHISQPDTLSTQAVENLNDYYVDHYSLSLDVEILLKQFLKRSGKHTTIGF
ncbi:MAG: glycosyltransferase [Ignavibacteria bacterium]|nr:glycosyltransferase [Ignavibacteria bacterium]